MSSLLPENKVNARVEVQGYSSKEARNRLADDQIQKSQEVRTVSDLERIKTEYLCQTPPLALAFILIAWGERIEFKKMGTLFTPLDASNFLLSPITFLKSIEYVIDLRKRREENLFNRTKKWS